MPTLEGYTSEAIVVGTTNAGTEPPRCARHVGIACGRTHAGRARARRCAPIALIGRRAMARAMQGAKGEPHGLKREVTMAGAGLDDDDARVRTAIAAALFTS